ncbi:hypothetical protein BSP109_01633 [Brevibacterium sp. Mu109]|uniref:hypothetical protein n=1 Tax=Brevibacterium sp. Mu109 TaxID=1255669 RepID=UPI000C4E7A18|nr:hypothetical protein [Brevibacterium sp. Mu109]SMX80652.1 hypothetical protein BSP109_01633 [Brevibacterium sp. Mu109]
MTIYARSINAEVNQHRKSIAAAYQAAGKTMPDTAGRVRELIVDTENVNEVASRLAREAYEADDPDSFFAAAIREVNEARAATELKDAYVRSANAAAQARLGRDINEAVKETSPTFNRTAKALATAARKLDPIEPLEAETAVALDAGEALTAARQALKQLGVFASIHRHFPNALDQRALRDLLPIIDIPTPTVEEVFRTVGAVAQTANEDELRDTRMLRQLHENLKRDADSTLISIARGDYPGVSLHLADVEEHKERLEKASSAFQRRTIEPSSRRAVFH